MATMTHRQSRRFVWRAVPGGGQLRKAEAADALQWLGRRLAFEDWLEELRHAAPEASSAA